MLSSQKSLARLRIVNSRRHLRQVWAGLRHLLVEFLHFRLQCVPKLVSSASCIFQGPWCRRVRESWGLLFRSSTVCSPWSSRQFESRCARGSWRRAESQMWPNVYFLHVVRLRRGRLHSRTRTHLRAILFLTRLSLLVLAWPRCRLGRRGQSARWSYQAQGRRTIWLIGLSSINKFN